MGALAEGLLECEFFIPPSKIKVGAYLEGLLESRCFYSLRD
jgi:hypothetical protein